VIGALIERMEGGPNIQVKSEPEDHTENTGELSKNAAVGSSIKVNESQLSPTEGLSNWGRKLTPDDAGSALFFEPLNKSKSTSLSVGGDAGGTRSVREDQEDRHPWSGVSGPVLVGEFSKDAVSMTCMLVLWLSNVWAVGGES
jgi:hypothetical protein